LEAQQLGQLEMVDPSFWHEVRASLVTAQVPAGAQATLLDVGAGGGLLGGIVRRDRPRVTYRFVEPIDSIAQQLELVHGKGSRIHDLAAEPLDEVDVFAMLDVLEHIEDDGSFLLSVVERARPGAVFVLTMPALPMLWSSWDEQLGHFRRYTRRTARSLIARVPFESAEVGYLFPELVPVGLMRRALRSRHKSASDGAEFPSLPRSLDRMLLRLGRLTGRGRRVWPFGTSVSVIARRAPTIRP
jgi:hypothetical protein